MGLFSSVGKALGKAAGAVFTGGASLLGGSSNPIKNFGGAGTIMNLYNKFSGNETSAKKMWDYQFNKMTAWEKEKALNSRAWDMQGLLNAGLNPAIAGSAGDTLGGGSPNPNEWTGTQENNQINSGLRFMELAQAREKMNAEIGQIQAQTEETTLQNDIVKKYGDKTTKQKLANLMLEAGEVRANTALKNQMVMSEMANEIYTRARTQNVNAETTGLSIENKGKQRTQDFHDNHPYMSKFITGYSAMRPLTQDLMTAVGLAGTAKKAGEIAGQMRTRNQIETHKLLNMDRPRQRTYNRRGYIDTYL